MTSCKTSCLPPSASCRTFATTAARAPFRGWLRTVLVHRLRDHQRSRRHQSLIANGEALLHRLEDPHDDLARTWDREHDEHVVGRLLELVRLDFDGRTWEAFRRTALEGESPAAVADSLGVTVHAVHQARYRVLMRLRREARGLVP